MRFTPATDAGDSIGWRYRAAGLASRVHQLLCDSRDFETADFGGDFFDTVADRWRTHAGPRRQRYRQGAQACCVPAACASGTTSVPIPRRCRTTWRRSASSQAIVENIDRWRPLFDRLYWIRRSWILVGERSLA